MKKQIAELKARIARLETAKSTIAIDAEARAAYDAAIANAKADLRSLRQRGA